MLIERIKVLVAKLPGGEMTGNLSRYRLDEHEQQRFFAHSAVFLFAYKNRFGRDAIVYTEMMK